MRELNWTKKRSWLSITNIQCMDGMLIDIHNEGSRPARLHEVSRSGMLASSTPSRNVNMQEGDQTFKVFENDPGRRSPKCQIFRGACRDRQGAETFSLELTIDSEIILLVLWKNWGSFRTACQNGANLTAYW